jgi:hypothetical protein
VLFYYFSPFILRQLHRHLPRGRIRQVLLIRRPLCRQPVRRRQTLNLRPMEELLVPVMLFLQLPVLTNLSQAHKEATELHKLAEQAVTRLKKRLGGAAAGGSEKGAGGVGGGSSGGNNDTPAAEVTPKGAIRRRLFLLRVAKTKERWAAVKSPLLCHPSARLQSRHQSRLQSRRHKPTRQTTLLRQTRPKVRYHLRQAVRRISPLLPTCQLRCLNRLKRRLLKLLLLLMVL